MSNEIYGFNPNVNNSKKQSINTVNQSQLCSDNKRFRKRYSARR